MDFPFGVKLDCRRDELEKNKKDLGLTFFQFYCFLQTSRTFKMNVSENGLLNTLDFLLVVGTSDQPELDAKQMTLQQ